VGPSARQSECLSDEEITELVEERVAGERRNEIEQHVAECPACAALVRDVAGAATMPPPRDVDHPLAPGDHVGRYEILRWIGAGAMGNVYAAHDPALDRKVALKLLRARLATPRLEARLLREAKAMARLSHPEIISVFDGGRHGDHLFIAMELVSGGTLRTWLGARPRTWREVLSVFVRAGRGLAQAHAAGIVHRDFKPDNVLVGDDGRVRVTDFGLARADAAEAPSDRDEHDQSKPVADAELTSASLTRTGTLVGTPAYMAPEQLAGQPADARSDLYSFCVALYEGLFGARPSGGETARELLAARLAGEVRPPPRRSPVPPRVKRMLWAGLRVRPEDRPASMTELLDALEAAAKARRLPFAIAGFGAALAAAGLFVVVERKPPREAPALLASGASQAAPSGGTNVASARDNPRPPPSRPPAYAPCATNRECNERHGGAPWICRPSDRVCVPVASEDCVPRFEAVDVAADDTVWLGALFPARGPKATAYGTMNLEGVELARKELAQATRALEGPTASLHVPRIALAACDDSEDPLRAARHLVDDVGVPAVLGFGSGQEVIDIAGGLLVRRGVLSVASLTPSPLVTRLPQPDDLPPMVWRTTFSLDDMAGATAHVIHDWLEPRVAARPGSTRVALARDDSASAVSFGEAFYKQLIFNGKTAMANGAFYQEVAFAAGELSEAEVGRVATRLVEMAPTFVVLLAADPTVAPIVEALESRWPTGTARPTYVGANSSFASLASFAGTSVERRRRLFAIATDSSSASNARFVMRYNESHEQHVRLLVNPATSYDAFYALAYAIYALRRTHITGPDLARAFGRLVPPGKPVEVGPTAVLGALRELAAGRRIDLQGAGGALDFDLATGDVESDFALLCPAVGPDGRALGEDVESGAVYRARTRRIEGAPRCP
jgi:tRNA A-37 threonylcarbamoyl transferase component Bud32/ABC-type branched-subunit amino acid transport system substrate-binding protein